MQSADADNLEKLRARDEGALRQWVERYHDDLYRFLRHLTRHRETAEDLAQQSFVRALEGLSAFEGRAGMRTWLHRIAFREYVGWRRKHRLMLPLELITHWTESHSDQVESGEVLLNAIHRLSAPLRETFLLHVIQELTVEEVAEVMGAPIGTVKSRLSIARGKLQEALENTFCEVQCEY